MQSYTEPGSKKVQEEYEPTKEVPLDENEESDDDERMASITRRFEEYQSEMRAMERWSKLPEEEKERIPWDRWICDYRWQRAVEKEEMRRWTEKVLSESPMFAPKFALSNAPKSEETIVGSAPSTEQ